jgi:hypothetical protein
MYMLIDGELKDRQADTTWRQRHRFSADAFVTALTSGGDSRVAIDNRTGTNKYFCPPTPAPGLVCLSSCTASPVTATGFRRAADLYADLIDTPALPNRTQALEHARHNLALRLLSAFGIAGRADAILCPSGTDALLTAATLLAGERPGQPITAILPEASETGSGVPLAVAGRWFDAAAPVGMAPPRHAVRTVEIALRGADGNPRHPVEVDADYAAAAAAAPGRCIVYLTHSSKTGLIAPMTPPPGADVIVDACQGRIDPATVAAYLRQGWPVVISGSKFFGGPAFAGAVLFPATRRTISSRPRFPGAANLGTVLRWAAALEAIEAFAPHAAAMADKLRDRTAAIRSGLEAIPALVPVGGLPATGPTWSELPSIFTFAVRDPRETRRLLSVAALRPLYESLAHNGILLGQPVGLGAFGGLRIAVGARDLSPDAPADGGLPQVFAALEAAVTASA